MSDTSNHPVDSLPNVGVDIPPKSIDAFLEEAAAAERAIAAELVYANCEAAAAQTHNKALLRELDEFRARLVEARRESDASKRSYEEAIALRCKLAEELERANRSLEISDKRVRTYREARKSAEERTTRLHADLRESEQAQEALNDKLGAALARAEALEEETKATKAELRHFRQVIQEKSDVTNALRAELDNALAKLDFAERLLSKPSIAKRKQDEDEAEERNTKYGRVRYEAQQRNIGAAAYATPARKESEVKQKIFATLCYHGSNCTYNSCHFAHKLQQLVVCPLGKKCQAQKCCFMLHSEDERERLSRLIRDDKLTTAICRDYQNSYCDGRCGKVHFGNNRVFKSSK